MVNTYDLINATEVADMMGLTRQRVVQLSAERDDFPTPVYDERRTRLWRRDDIRQWGQDNGYIKRF